MQILGWVNCNTREEQRVNSHWRSGCAFDNKTFCAPCKRRGEKSKELKPGGVPKVTCAYFLVLTMLPSKWEHNIKDGSHEPRALPGLETFHVFFLDFITNLRYNSSPSLGEDCHSSGDNSDLQEHKWLSQGHTQAVATWPRSKVRSLLLQGSWRGARQVEEGERMFIHQEYTPPW